MGILNVPLMTWSYLATGEQGRNPSVSSLCALARELKVDGLDWITMQGHDPRETRKMTDGCDLKNICCTFFSDMEKPDDEVRRKGTGPEGPLLANRHIGNQADTCHRR